MKGTYAVPLEQKKIIARRSLIQRLRDLEDSLAFNEEHTTEALMIIARENNVKWCVAEKELLTWARGMSTRLRAMLRHTQQARVKKEPPSWIASLELPTWRRAPRGSDEEPKDKKAVSAKSDEAEADNIRIGFDRDTGLAVKEMRMQGRSK